MSVYAGLDGGSTYLKAALIDQMGKVLNTGVVSTGIDNNGAAKELLKRLTRERGVDRIAYTMATGYSRKILETADAASSWTSAGRTARSSTWTASTTSRTSP